MVLAVRGRKDNKDKKDRKDGKDTKRTTPQLDGPWRALVLLSFLSLFIKENGKLQKSRLLLGIGLHGPLDQIAIEVVDRHSGVDHDLLGVDAAGTRAQQEGRDMGRFFGLHSSAAERRLLGVKIGIDVARDTC